MFKRINLILWILAGAIPIAGWLFGRPQFAAFSGLTYLVGSCAMLAALRRDPQEQVLRSFYASRSGRLWLVVATILVVWCGIGHLGTGMSVLILLSTIVALGWAFSSTSKALAHKINRLLLVVTTVAFCIFAGEMAVRIMEGTRPSNDGSTWTWGHRVENNRLGFRERDFAIPKEEGVYRVMVLGDSLTWGAGLAEEERYTNLIQEEFGKAHPEKRVEVLNFALCGCPTTTERDILSKHVDEVDPDQIVVGFCVNDPQPKSENYATELENYRFLLDTAQSLHRVRATRLASFLYWRIDQLLRNVGCVPDTLSALDRTYHDQSPEWLEFVQALRDIKNVSDRRGLPAPIFAPLLQGSGDYNTPNESLAYFLKWYRQAESAAQEAGFVMVNMETSFKAQGDSDRAVNPWDGHPNAECNAIYARHIGTAILDSIDSESVSVSSRRPRSSVE